MEQAGNGGWLGVGVMSGGSGGGGCTCSGGEEVYDLDNSNIIVGSPCLSPAIYVSRTKGISTMSSSEQQVYGPASN